MHETAFGLYLEINWLGGRDALMLGCVMMAGALAGLFPALRAYRNSVADGMVVRT